MREAISHSSWEVGSIPLMAFHDLAMCSVRMFNTSRSSSEVARISYGLAGESYDGDFGQNCGQTFHYARRRDAELVAKTSLSSVLSKGLVPRRNLRRTVARAWNCLTN